MKRKMLLLTPELPYPLQSGGKVKTWNMITSLAKDWDITMVCPLKEGDSQYVEEFKAKAPITQLHARELTVARSALNLLRSYVRGIPLNVFRTREATLINEVDRIIDDFEWVLIDHYEAFQFLPRRITQDKQRDTKLIYHAHNAYHQFWSRYAKTTYSVGKKLVCYFEHWRVLRHEKSVCDQADLCFAAPNDIESLVAVGCDRAKFKETLHLGDDHNLELPELTVGATTPKLCYAGLLSWEPNVQGLLWFIEEVWPDLKQHEPALRLEIAGKNPDPRLVAAVAANDGIKLLGFVDDLEELYRDARIAICPLLFGSGTKVKVANAMARGIPMVTTPIGAEGLAVEHGEHLMICDNPMDTIASLMMLLQNDILWRRLSHQSRSLMREQYSWQQLFEKMHSEISAVLKTRSMASNSPALAM